MRETREFSSAADLAEVTHPTHPGEPMQTRWAWVDIYDGMKVGESKSLVNGLGRVSTVTRTTAGWTLAREES